jgi:hypothetical protein
VVLRVATEKPGSVPNILASEVSFIQARPRRCSRLEIMMRDLGRMGEDAFSYLCNTTGLIANKAFVDKTGWDFLVEFPVSRNNMVPLDMQQSPIQCKFQIKSTDTNVRKISISLSNLDRLVKDPLPAIYCLFDFNGKNEVQQIYCLHIDDNIMEKTLKELRKIGIDADAKLNKKTINIHFEEKHKLIEPTGEQLVKVINSFIGNDFAKYIDTKKEKLIKLGFGAKPYGLRFSLNSKEDVVNIVDAYLGIDCKINVSNAEGFTVRFGIEMPDSKVSAKKAELKISPQPIKNGLLRFRESKFSPPMDFICDIYIPPFRIKKHEKIRLVTTFFEIIIDSNRKQIHLTHLSNPDLAGKPHQIRNWLKLSNLLKLKDITMTIQMLGIPELELGLLANNNCPDNSEPLILVEALIDVYNYFEINIDSLIKLSDIDLNTKEIIQMSSIIKNDSHNITLSFSHDSFTYREDALLACILRIDVCLLNYHLTLIVSIVDKVHKIGDTKYQVNSDKLTIHKSFNGLEDFPTDKDLEDYFIELAEDYQNNGTQVIFLLEQPKVTAPLNNKKITRHTRHVGREGE